jgi:hypothetical protein
MLELDDCLAAFGLPYPLGTRCEGTSDVEFPGTVWLVSCGKEACCVDATDFEPRLCADLLRGECLDPFLFGGRHAPKGVGSFCGAQTGRLDDFDFQCDVDGFSSDGEFTPFKTCCFADGQSSRGEVSERECEFLGGIAVGLTEPCPPIDLDTQCREPIEDEGLPGTFRWTLDACANVALEPVMRPAGHRDSVSSPPGYFDLFTMRRARALGALGTTTKDCQNYYTEMTVGDDGYGQPLMCSDHNDLEFTPGMAMLSPDNELAPKGYAMFLAAYHTPFWSEILFDSHLIRCGGGTV